MSIKIIPSESYSLNNNPKEYQPIGFSHNYPKLKCEYFSTIRRYDMGFVVGQIRHIQLDGTLRLAKIVCKHFKMLSELSTEFLCYDTNTKSREEAIKLLNSFYKNPVNDTEILTVIVLRWIQ